MNRAKRERFAKPENFREIWMECLVEGIIECFSKRVKKIEADGHPLPETIPPSVGFTLVFMIVRDTLGILNQHKDDVGQPMITMSEIGPWMASQCDEWISLLPSTQHIRQGKKIAYIIYAVLERCMGQKEVLKLEGAMMQEHPGFRNAIMKEVMRELGMQ